MERKKELMREEEEGGGKGVSGINMTSIILYIYTSSALMCV